MDTYYDPADLPKFGNIAEGAPELAKKFFAWYGAVFEDGALTAREKSLIALAVSHAVQCPYCIDAYTKDSLEKGADLEQMTEAVHVASAIRGGASLVHGVQMQNIAHKLGCDVSALVQIEEHLASLGVDLTSEAGGPKRAKSLLSRRAPLAAPATQLHTLGLLDLGEVGEFDEALARVGFPDGLAPGALEIFQINIGKLCNMTCRHCHVDSGPDRLAENMDRATVDACIRALDQTDAHTVDITGGAPELNPHFRYLVDACVERGKHVIDRCNLTVLLLPRFRDLPEYFAERGVEVVCSLPHYRKRNTDAQRGDGTFEKSIRALKRLNDVGYGTGDPKRMLTLMSNPAGAFLAGSQAQMEGEWKRGLLANHQVTFDRLFCLNNMPISRYLEWLLEKGQLQAYMERLTNAFNPAAVSGLMCRNTLSISWDGRLFDCDFNQMLDLDIELGDGERPSVHDLDVGALMNRQVITRRHCFGCTAGSGSSCGGATS